MHRPWMILGVLALAMTTACGVVRGGGGTTPTPTGVIPIASPTPSPTPSPAASRTAASPTGSGTPRASGPVERTVTAPSTGLQMILRLPAPHFAVGEPITARLVVRNLTSRPVGVAFPDGCGEHITIADHKGRIGGPGIGCSDAITPFIYEPGERTVTTIEWSAANGDDPARPGRYTATGRIPGWLCPEVRDDPSIPDRCYQHDRRLEPEHRTPAIRFTVG